MSERKEMKAWERKIKRKIEAQRAATEFFGILLSSASIGLCGENLYKGLNLSRKEKIEKFKDLMDIYALSETPFKIYWNEEEQNEAINKAIENDTFNYGWKADIKRAAMRIVGEKIYG